MPEADHDYLTGTEVAAVLKVAPATVKYWRAVRKGPPHFVVPGSSRVLYPRHELEAWLAEGRAAHTRFHRNRSVPSHRGGDLDHGIGAR